MIEINNKIPIILNACIESPPDNVYTNDIPL